MTGTRDLIASAFGASANLYSDVLQCPRNATPAELKRAYYRRALVFHPDKQLQQADNNKRRSNNSKKDSYTTSTKTTTTTSANSTRCFQALSATYELLRDERKRQVYDRTGQIVDDNEDVEEEDEVGEYRRRRGSDNRNRRGKSNKHDDDEEDRRWQSFFWSVFNEIKNPHTQADEDGIDKSKKETVEVLKFYVMCKGDLDKVVNCMVNGKAHDKKRWVDTIIEPAIERGEVARFNALERTTTADAASAPVKQCKKKKQVLSSQKSGDDLVDTDDEEEERTGAAAPVVMSKKDKLDFAVAKKRKRKREKELELAKIVEGKTWQHGIAKSHGKRQRTGTFRENFLSNLEGKYKNKQGKKARK